MTFTRDVLEEVCADLFGDCLRCLDEFFAVTQLVKSDVDEVVLVGGTTRMPKIREIVASYFSGVKVNYSIDPEVTVATGATIQCAILQGVDVMQDVVLVDVTPLSIGVELGNGLINVMIPKNTPIPTSRTDNYTTDSDYQEGVSVNIYEGE